VTVDVYTKPNCQACKLTKRHLGKHGIEHTELDINEIIDEAKDRGIASAPVIAIDGELKWGGYRPDRIDALVS
jgi:glutaredoxin-like protein NrdH